jgi:meso-butanediol dehydrogenase / (S,S)-butanediol dehydrogenase / diacetyl reductase
VASGRSGSVTERLALVTGAGRGVGRAIALRLAADNYLVAVNDVSADLVNQVVGAIVEQDGKAVAAAMDVGDVAGTRDLVDQLLGTYGELAVLVNNAGLIRFNPFGEVTEEDWDTIFRVNARGLFFLLQHAGMIMRRQGHGAVVNIASITGRGAPTSAPPYAATKAAVINMTQTAARALAGSGVRVNAICPGIIDTALNEALDRRFGVEEQGFSPGEFLRQKVAGVPMGRIGLPEEVAELTAFLVGEGAAYITGQAINIDGGILFS